VLAGVDRRHVAQRPPGHDRRDDAADLGGQDARRPAVGKAGGDGFARGLHQRRIDLVIQKAVDLQDAAAEVFPFAANTIFKCFHFSSLELGVMTPT